MATGIEVYQALRSTTSNLSMGSDYFINKEDALDLRKLKTSDLVSFHFEEKTAEEVSAALREGDFGPLGQAMGLRLAVQDDAERLLPGADS
jgi:hypothetical protein